MPVADYDYLEVIECDVDLVREAGTGRWFFHQQEHETPYRHRDSTSYDTKLEAKQAWPEMVVWESWPAMVDRCSDCGEQGHTVGDMGCQYPQDHQC